MFIGLAIQISVALETILEALGQQPNIDVSKDKEHFRLNIKIADQEYFISIQYKGLELDAYYDELLDIVKKYIELYQESRKN